MDKTDKNKTEIYGINPFTTALIALVKYKNKVMGEMIKARRNAKY